MMEMTGFTRREFLKGALAFAGLGALGARRLLAVPLGWKPSGALRLTFGIISDTHYMLSLNRETLAEGSTDAYVLNALNYFKSRNVDAVMHCGDMANWGIIKEMQLLADNWFSVFPNNRAPDGHEVAKLFVPGNHDIDGATNKSERLTAIYGSDYQQYLLVNSLAESWKSIWKEDYSEAWHKTVKGYHFFGYNAWSGESKFDANVTASEQAVAELITAADAAGQLDGTKPFFLMSHIRQRRSLMTPLAPYTNCLGFWGHYHNSCGLWDEGELCWWEGATFPRLQCPSLHATASGNLPDNLPFAKAKDHLVEGYERMWEAGINVFQGLLVSVYDDAVVIERHDFDVGHNNAKIGPDWVMPIAEERYTKANHPFSQTELKKTDQELGAPQFKLYASLGIELDNEKVRVTIPKANGNANTRALIFNVEVAGTEDETSLWKSIYAKGCDEGIGYEANGGVTVLDIPRDELPAGERLTVRAYPVSPLGLEGTPLSAPLYVMNKVRVVIDKDSELSRVGEGRYAVTKGANLPNADNLEFVLPKWVKCATVEDGEIVIYTKPAPLVMIIW